MKFRTFCGLVRWAFEEHLSFPMLEVLIVSAVIGVLAQTAITLEFQHNYSVLYQLMGTLFMFLTFSVGAVFARGFAGSSSKGEDKLLLSYPVKRGHLFISKFIAMFFTFIVVFFAAYSMHIYLAVLSPFEPMFYVGLFGLFLQILLVCAVTITISIFTKNEAVSILSSVLLLIGIDSIAGGNSYLSAEGRLQYICAYFGQLIRDEGAFPIQQLFDLTTEGVIMVISIPLIISVLLLVLSFVYFTRFMEVD